MPGLLLALAVFYSEEFDRLYNYPYPKKCYWLNPQNKLLVELWQYSSRTGHNS